MQSRTPSATTALSLWNCQITHVCMYLRAVWHVDSFTALSVGMFSRTLCLKQSIRLTVVLYVTWIIWYHIILNSHAEKHPDQPWFMIHEPKCNWSCFSFPTPTVVCRCCACTFSPGDDDVIVKIRDWAKCGQVKKCAAFDGGMSRSLRARRRRESRAERPGKEP